MTYRSEVAAPLSEEAMNHIMDVAAATVDHLGVDTPHNEAIARLTGFDPEVLQQAIGKYGARLIKEVGERHWPNWPKIIGEATGELAVVALVFGIIIGRETAPEIEREVDGNGHTE
jgi:hypothetical protein